MRLLALVLASQTIVGPEPVPRWREERTRPVPAAVVPANLNAILTAAVQPITGPARISGSVIGPDGPIAGATLTLVAAPEKKPLTTVSDRCLARGGGRPCLCGNGAKELVALLEQRADEPRALPRTKSDAKGAFGLRCDSRVWADATGLGSTLIEIALVPTLPLRGVVLDEMADPVAGAVVTMQAGGYRYFDTVTGADGKYEFTNLSGYGGLVARRSGYLPRWVHPERVERIVLAQPRSLRTRVLFEGKPAVDVAVGLKGGGCQAQVSSDKNGDVVFDDLLPIYEATMTARRDFLFASRLLAIGRHDEERVAAPLTLRPTGELELTVVDHKGRPDTRGTMTASQGQRHRNVAEQRFELGAVLVRVELKVKP